MKIHKIHFNWRQVGNVKSGFGEDYDIFEVDKDGVKSIQNVTSEEFYCGSELYDVTFDDGHIERLSNANRVFFEPLPSKKRV